MDEIEKLVERLGIRSREHRSLFGSSKDYLLFDEAASTLTTQAAELARKDARIKELEAGLRPFAEAARDADVEHVRDSAPAWESPMAMAVDHGDFRRARSLVPDGEAR